MGVAIRYSKGDSPSKLSSRFILAGLARSPCFRRRDGGAYGGYGCRRLRQGVRFALAAAAGCLAYSEV